MHEAQLLTNIVSTHTLIHTHTHTHTATHSHTHTHCHSHTHTHTHTATHTHTHTHTHTATHSHTHTHTLLHTLTHTHCYTHTHTHTHCHTLTHTHTHTLLHTHTLIHTHTRTHTRTHTVLEGFEILHPSSQFRSARRTDQQLLTKQQPATGLAEQYESANKIPALHLFTPLREDGKNAMLFFSDSEFFFEHWRVNMRKKMMRRKTAADLLSVSCTSSMCASISLVRSLHSPAFYRTVYVPSLHSPALPSFLLHWFNNAVIP